MSMVDVRHKTVNAVYSVEGYATLALGLGKGKGRGSREISEARMCGKSVRKNTRIT